MKKTDQLKSEIVSELRKFNENHGPDGKFASGDGGGSNGGTKNEDEDKKLRQEAVFLSKRIGQMRDEAKLYATKDKYKYGKMQAEITKMTKRLQEIHRKEGIGK